MNENIFSHKFSLLSKFDERDKKVTLVQLTKICTRENKAFHNMLIIDMQSTSRTLKPVYKISSFAKIHYILINTISDCFTYALTFILTECTLTFRIFEWEGNTTFLKLPSLS